MNGCDYEESSHCEEAILCIIIGFLLAWASFWLMEKFELAFYGTFFSFGSRAIREVEEEFAKSFFLPRH